MSSEATENNSANFKKEELSSQTSEEVCILEALTVGSAAGPPRYQRWEKEREKKWSPKNHRFSAQVGESPPLSTTAEAASDRLLRISV